MYVIYNTVYGGKLPEILIRCICKSRYKIFGSIREDLDGGCDDVTALLLCFI